MKRLRILHKTFHSGAMGIMLLLAHIGVIILSHVDNTSWSLAQIVILLLLTSLNPFILILEGKYYLDIIFFPERSISGKIIDIEANYNLLKRRYGIRCDKYVIWCEECQKEITLYCYRRVYCFYTDSVVRKIHATPNFIKCRYLWFTKLITAVEYVEYPEVLSKKRRKRKKSDYRRVEREKNGES